MSGLTNWVRSRSREQWLELWREKFTDIRIWIQEHPEKAFVVALVAGAMLMLLFRIVIWLVILTLLIGWLIWCFALPEAGITTSTVIEPRDDDTSPGGTDE